MGKSCIDYLPDGVTYSIYYFKHQLEFGPTLNILPKLRIAIDSEIVETRIPIEKLLEIVTNNNHMSIYVAPSDTTENYNNPYKIQKEFNTRKIEFHHGLGAFCELEIEFKDKVQLMTIDILHIIHQLGFSKELTKF